ncbi:tyrosine-type recombinase/integrase [Lutibacter sp.]|uniref:tyrosine-type recombinase/integrase n=1 Tax=Lutibacter sp. TaxID=1925666 RepID=UPI003564CB4F
MTIKLRQKKLAKGAISFYLDIYNNGKRTYEFLEVKIFATDEPNIKKQKKQIAELLRANKEVELLSNRTDYVPEHKINTNFFDFANTFISNYQKKDVRMINAALEKFKEFHKSKNLYVSEITPVLMYGFKDYLNYKSGLTGETPHNYFTRFKKILRDAELKGLLKKNPTSEILFKKNSSDSSLKKQVLTTEELQILAKVKCGNENVKKAFLFACFTGLGEAELKVLKWSNISNNQLTTIREKTNQKVQLKLKETTQKLLGERKEKKETIFNLKNENNNFLSTNAINKCIKNWVERAGIDKHITFYCARHTFATQLLQYGANLKTVADAMGHTSTKSTIKYLNYIENLKDEAIDNLPDIKF